jgi:hypothetical protein
LSRDQQKRRSVPHLKRRSKMEDWQNGERPCDLTFEPGDKLARLFQLCHESQDSPPGTSARPLHSGTWAGYRSDCKGGKVCAVCAVCLSGD